MSYHRRIVSPRPIARAPVRALSGDTAHGPSWYTSMGGMVSRPAGARISRRLPELGSLGADPDTSTAVQIDSAATAQWQDAVLKQLQAGVDTLKRAELQKWLQIVATVSIPLSAAIWKMIFKRGSVTETGI